MLSDVQSWRKLRSRSGNRHRRKHDLAYQQHLTSPEGAADSKELPSASTSPPSSSGYEAVRDKGAAQLSSAGKRKVRFNPVIRVCLVPCRNDFRADFYALFWEKEDYQCFKEDALRELRAHWMEHKTSVKEAIFALYQPSPLDDASRPRKLLAHVDSMGVMTNLGLQNPANCIKHSPEGEAPQKSCLKKTASHRETTGDAPIGSEDGEFVPTEVINGVDLSPPPENSSGAVNTASAVKTPTSTSGAPGLVGSSPLVTVSNPHCTGDVAGASGGLSALLTSGATEPVTPMHKSSDPSLCSAQSQPHPYQHQSPNSPARRPPLVPESAASASASTSSVVIDGVFNTPTGPSSSSADGGARAGLEREQRASSDGQLSAQLAVSVGSAGSRDSGSGKEGKEGGVRIILLEESPCSSVSSFEAPILIC